MNQVLKNLAASIVESDWESDHSGTVLNFCVIFREAEGRISSEEHIKVKQWTVNPSAAHGDVLPFRNTVVGKILEAHSFIRGSLLKFTTEAKLRREKSYEVILRAITLQYRAVVREKGNEQHPRFTIEFDSWRKPGDRLAIVFSSETRLDTNV